MTVSGIVVSILVISGHSWRRSPWPPTCSSSSTLAAATWLIYVHNYIIAPINRSGWRGAHFPFTSKGSPIFRLGKTQLLGEWEMQRKTLVVASSAHELDGGEMKMMLVVVSVKHDAKQTELRKDYSIGQPASWVLRMRFYQCPWNLIRPKCITNCWLPLCGWVWCEISFAALPSENIREN